MSARACVLLGLAMAGVVQTYANGRLKPADYTSGSVTQAPQQTFRTATDVVMVDVAVRSGGRYVPGLTAGDFVLTDNGVPQRIESVETTAVPLDVTLVVDLSGSRSRPWRSRRLDPEQPKQIVTRELLQVARILRPTDRVRLLTVDRYVRQIFPFVAKDRIPAIGTLEFDGLASLYDGLAAALMQPVEPARRHVVVARAKGIDAQSVLSASAIRSIASRADAQFHIVLMEAELDNENELANFQCNTPMKGPVDIRIGPLEQPSGIQQPMGLCSPVNRFYIPPLRWLVSSVAPHVLRPDGELIKAGAQSTGGDLHQALLVSEPTLTGTFTSAFENFRSSYMLRYTPERVARAGWHSIEVTIPKSRGYEVNARRGYAIEARAPAPPSPAIPPANTVLKTIAEITAAYERKSYGQSVGSIRQAADPLRLLQEFETTGNPWPGVPRREAAFALDLVEPVLFSSRESARDDGLRFLERVTRWVRQPLDPDDFEREWHFAALTLLQGTVRPGPAQPAFNYAVDRFPDDARFKLLRAINTEQSSVSATRLSALAPSGAPRTDTVELARQQYEEAIAHPSTAAEARVRLGWMLHRAGRSNEALVHLNVAGAMAAAEPAIRYLQRLALGHVLAAANRLEDAIVAFRGASREMPDAQSARVALMNALMMHGERTEAAALAEQVQSARGDSRDPWWTYWQGQYRFHGEAMARLREMAR